MDECLKSVADGKALLATSISSYVSTASDASFSTIDTNMKSAFTKRYNSGVSAADARVNTSSASYQQGLEDGTKNSSYTRLCLLSSTTRAFIEGYVTQSFQVLDTDIFTNTDNTGILTVKRAGTYTVFADGYFSYFWFYVKNASGTNLIEPKYLVNQRYFDVTLEVGNIIYFADTYDSEGNNQLHAVIGIFQSP